MSGKLCCGFDRLWDRPASVLPDELRVGLPLLTKSLRRRFQVLNVAEEIIVQVLIITQDSSQAELGHVSNDPIGVAQ